MQAQREALAALMGQVAQPSGSSRGGDRSRSRRRRRHGRGSSSEVAPWYDDKSLCAAYLCSVCPFELLSGTKDCIGNCHRRHDEAVRQSYLRAREQSDQKDCPDVHEEHVLKRLRSVLADRDEYIEMRRAQAEAAAARAAEKEEQQPQAAPAVDDERAKKRIEQLSEEAREHMSVAEELGRSGHGQEAEEALAQAARATRERDLLRRAQAAQVLGRGYRRGAPAGPKRPCEVCGGMIPEEVEAEFIAGHRNGKMHQAWVQLRDEHSRLQKRAEAVHGSAARASSLPVATPVRALEVASREVRRASACGASEVVAWRVARRAAMEEKVKERAKGSDSRALLRRSRSASGSRRRARR